MRHLVVVIPGIGGSVLASVDLRGPAVWDTSVAGSVRTLVDPSLLSVDDHPVLRPTGLVQGVTVFGRFTVLPGYAGLVRSLCNGFGVSQAVLTPDTLPDPRADLLLFPYDFRLGVAAAANRLAQALHPLVGADDARWPGRPVLIVAHSMGGLVARYWIGPLAGWRQCAGLVTLGTPHRGAPKALDWLVNGVRLGRTWQRATNVVRGWQGAWDLVPRYDAIWDQNEKRAVRPEQLGAGCVSASGVLVSTADSVPAALRSGASTHSEIAAGWGDIPAGRAPAMHVVFARGHDTPSAAYLSARRLHVTKHDPAWLPLQGWPGGDGSVPAFSAVPVELADDQRVRVPVWQRHGPMGSSPEPVRIVNEYEAGSTAAIRGDSDAGIAMDLAEFPQLGSRVTATMWNAEPGPDSVVTMQARPAGVPAGSARKWVDAMMVRTGEARWEAELPAAEPGTFEVRVTAAGVPRVSPLPASDLVEVLADREFVDEAAECGGVE